MSWSAIWGMWVQIYAWIQITVCHGPAYPRWTNTILSLDGKIALGEKFNLVSSLDPKRTFKLKVKEFIANKKLCTGDGMGTRSYILTKDQNVTNFVMTEKIGGTLFPLFAKMIPSFDESFDKFAADLKKEAENMAGF